MSGAMSSSVKAVSNTVFLTLDWISVTILSFLYSFVIWKTLSPWDYGIISTSVNLMMILGNISLFGMHATVQKLIAEYAAKNQKGKIGSLIRMSLVVVFVADAIICSALLLNRYSLASALKTTENVIWMVCIGTVVFSLFYISTNILFGFQDMKGYFKTSLAGNILKFLVSTGLILLGFGYFGPLIGVAIGFAVVPFLRFKPHWFYKSNGLDRKKIILEYSLPAFLAMLATLTFNNAHYVILTVIKTPEITGLFSLAMVISALIALIPNIITQAIFPIMSQLSVNKKSNNKQARLINTALRYSLFFAIPFSSAIVIMMRPLILFLKIKTEYLPAVQYLPMLAMGSLLLGCGGIFLSSIYAIGKPKVNRNIAVLAAIVFLMASIPMTYLFSAYGLAFSFLAVSVIQFSLSYFYIKKFLPLKLPIASILKILVASVIFIILLYNLEKYFESFVLKAIVALASFAVYIAFLVLSKFFNGQDVFIVRHIAGNLPKPIRRIAEFFCSIFEKFI